MQSESSIPNFLVEEMIDYLYMTGHFSRSRENASFVEHIPTIIFPTEVPLKLFEKIEFYQVAFNKLIHKMSLDPEYLHETLNQ